MIRKSKYEEFQKISDLWLKASLQAHSFINENHWIEQKALLCHDFLPSVETFVFEDKHKLKGFICLGKQNKIAALYVAPEFQNKKIGTKLLNYIRRNKPNLSLDTYAKNAKALRFYQKHNFKIIAEYLEENTSEKKLLLSWALGCLSGYCKKYYADS